LENPKKVMELHNKWVKECPEGYFDEYEESNGFAKYG